MKKNPYPGNFIVFEGLDGSGQSTQALKLKEFLKKNKISVHLTKEPTSGLIGGLIRSQLNKEWSSSQECLQLLFAADRAYHLEKEVIPLLKKGVVVISDRYILSSLAYGGTKIKDKNWLKLINDKFIIPDLTIFLDVTPQESLKRIKESRFNLELFENLKFLKMVYKNYKELVDYFPNTFVVDGTKSPKIVFNKVKKIVFQKIKKI